LAQFGSNHVGRWLAIIAVSWLLLGHAADAQEVAADTAATVTSVRGVRASTPGASPIDTAWRASSRDRQSMWLLSTRRLASAGAARSASPFVPEVSRFDAGTGWVSSSLEELIAAGQSARATSLYFHGNDTNAQEAAVRGESLYQELRGAREGMSSIDTVQFVVWSWPSHIPGARVRESAQANSLRTDVEGQYLADYLNRVSPEVPVNLCGYCTGARIATGGLHLLARKRSAELPPGSSSLPRRGIRAVLLAGAVPHDWLLPGQPQERALSQLERLVITVNSTDPVLRWYPLTWGRGGPAALGMTGIAEPWKLGEQQAKVVHLDLEPALRRAHSWQYYRGSPQIMALLRSELLNTRATVVR